MLEGYEQYRVENAERILAEPYTFESGEVYHGQWLGTNRDGYGSQVWPNGSRYDGNSSPHTHLFIFTKGYWANDKAQGQVKIQDASGDVYEG